MKLLLLALLVSAPLGAATWTTDGPAYQAQLPCGQGRVVQAGTGAWWWRVSGYVGTTDTASDAEAATVGACQ